MGNILEEIAGKTRERISEKKKLTPLEVLRNKALSLVESSPRKKVFPFENALLGDDIRFICEVKKASPSRGVIAEDFNYREIAVEYEKAGAAAISVLTEPFYFKGSDDFLRQIADVITIPILRKDFVIDEYMIYEAKVLGASAVLLICSILDKDELLRYIDVADNLGLSALVEVHNESEIEMALSSNARIIGVNNRDLKTFEVDISLSERLRPLVPKDIIFVAESGIKTPKDIDRIRKIKGNAVLIGEVLMRSTDKGAEIKRLLGEVD